MAANLALVSKGLRVGDRDPVVIQVRQLLAKAGVLANYTVSDPNLFDSGLGQLVVAFQKAKGLQPDGIVGPRTWSLLGGSTVGASPPSVTPPTQNDVPTQPAPPAGPGGASGFPFMLAAGALAAAAGLYWYSKRKSSGGGSDVVSTLSGWLGGPVEDEAKRVERNLKARARRHAKEREEQNAAARAAWELAKRTPDVIGAQLEAETQRLVRAGYRPTDAAMRARAQLMSRNPGVSTQARIESTVRSEAARLTPIDPNADKAERVNIERQRRLLTEKMMRTGLGPMKNVTQATHNVRSVSPTRPAQEIFPQGVRAAIAPPIGPKMLPNEMEVISVDADEYANNKAYREEMKERAKRTAIERGRPVRIVGKGMQGSLVESTETRGARALYPSTFTPSMKVGSKDKNAGQASSDARFPVRPSVRLDPDIYGPSPSRTLWTYDPSRRKPLGRFRDMVTDSLIDEPATLATEGDCEGAVKTLLKRRTLAATPREAELQKRVITVVHNRCAPELERAVTVAANERANVEAQFPSSPLTRAEAKGAGLRSGSRREVRIKRDAETRAEEAWWAADARGELTRKKTGGRPRGAKSKAKTTKASDATVDAELFYSPTVLPKGGTPYYLRPETETKAGKKYRRIRRIKTTDPRIKTTGS